MGIFCYRGRWIASVLAVGLLVGLVWVRAAAPHEMPAAIAFSPEERAWMEANPMVRVAPDPDFPPVEFFNDDGEYRGIAADFIRHLGQHLPLRFEIVTLPNWSTCLEQARSRQIDLLGAAVPTPDRLHYLRFTKPFVQFPAVVLVRDGSNLSPTVRSMKGLKVAVVAGYAAHEFMVDRHPEADLLVMPDIASGLREVSVGRVDAMVLNLASASYYIEKEGITNLRIHRDTDFMYDLSFAARSDWPLLASVLQKAVDSLSEEQSRALLAPWIGLREERWQFPAELAVAFSGVAVVVLVCGVLLWNRSLRRLVNQRTTELQRELADRQRAEQVNAELQQAAHRARKMEALGLLAGGVAHDLNNILSGVVNYPELLLMKLPADSPLRDPLYKIRESGERAAAVVADLLTMARGAASEQVSVDVNAMLQRAMQTPEYQELVARFPRARLRLQMGDGPLCVSGSPVHLQKCLLNLVLNAMEALPDGCGEVRVSTQRCRLREASSGFIRVEAGEYVRLSVRDDGAGIEAGDLERIFEPFYSRKVLGRSGTGLGLALVWNTVRDHGGQVDVSSGPHGTRFDLYFPPGEEAQADPVAAVDMATLRGHGQRILVVDDESSQREISRQMLEALNYRVETAASGALALAAMGGQTFDLLVLDMVMDPGLSGHETYERALELRPGQPAIIASGFAETEDVRRVQAMGAGRFLRKPFALEVLGCAVREELTRHGLAGGAGDQRRSAGGQ